MKQSLFFYSSDDSLQCEVLLIQIIKTSMKLFIRYLLLSVFFFNLTSFNASAEDVFFIDDIRIEGLQRVSAKTIFSILPIKVNSEVSTQQLQDAVREMFKAGFFSDVAIERDGSVLVLNVVERAVINEIEVSGNKVIETEFLLEGLSNVGLIEGEIFKQSALEAIERELNAQYSSVGRYATQIQTTIVDLPKNRVKIDVHIIEGEVASIKHINIVGNKDFSEKDLQLLFDIKKTGKWSWLTGNDKYAQQKLSGDLERLKAFYFNKGYLEFDTTSTQVSISPDKETVYITVNIFEGKPYKIREVVLAGDPIVSTKELNELLTVKKGELFSQNKLLTSSQAIEKRLGDVGYSYAKVRGVPDLDKEAKTAKITFVINPGTINYVRRIIFKGNTTTQDRVLRREMRQLEGAPVSTEKLTRSRARLQKLPLFSDVTMTTQDVPGRPDQIDVIFTVVEQASGSINASIGFSQGNGLTLGAGVQQDNWLGTGNTLGFQIDNNDVETGYNFNFSNPYFTKDGVSRGVSIFYRERDLDELEVSSYSTDEIGGSVTFGYPISERSRISFSVGIQKTSVSAGFEAVQEISGSPRRRSGVDNEVVSDANYQTILPNLSDTNNNGFFDELDGTTVAGTAGATTPLVDSQLAVTPQGFLDRHGDDFTTLNFSLGWSDSTLNRGIFPTRGSSQRVNAEITAPGGDLEYYKLTYKGELYRALSKNLTVRIKSRFGYADSYGNIDELPFFENFLSGGTGSVRGFDTSTLGPKGTPSSSYIAVPYLTGGNTRFAYVDDGSGGLRTSPDLDVQTLGGNILFETGVELIFPVPFSRNSKSLRTVFFVDAGNVFSDSCTSTQKNCSNLDFSKLSAAAGLGLQWISPVGPLSVYFTKAVQKQSFDKTKTFQFTLGQSF